MYLNIILFNLYKLGLFRFRTALSNCEEKLPHGGLAEGNIKDNCGGQTERQKKTYWGSAHIFRTIENWLTNQHRT